MVLYACALLVAACGLVSASPNKLGRQNTLLPRQQQKLMQRTQSNANKPGPRTNLKNSKIIPPPPGITAITDVLHSKLVTIVDQQTVNTTEWMPLDVSAHCSWLDHDVWKLECNPKSQFYKKLEPITTYIAVAKDHYIDFNSVHDKVPGTVFRDDHYFCPQHYVRPPRGMVRNPIVLDKVATVLQSYPTGFGHFPHEILPKLVYMLEKVPEDVKFLLDVSPFTDQYLKIVGLNESRIIRYHARAHKVYLAKEVYFSSTDPFVDSTDPHKGGKTFLFPKNLFDMMRKRLLSGIPPSKEVGRNDLVVLIRRQRSARNLTNFAELHDALSAKVGSDRLRVFEGTESVAQAIRLFHSAAMVIGVHGGKFTSPLFVFSSRLHILI